MLVSRSTCAQVNFPAGHPKNKVVYVRHPWAKDLYYPIAQFHKYLFQHKYLEAVRLLRSLGAKSIEVHHEVGLTQERVGKLSAPAGMTGITAGVKVGTKRKSSVAVFYSATFNPSKTRSVPKDLVWFSKEPQWQAIADDALNNRVTEFALEVAESDNYGVNASVKADLAGYDFEVGGQLEDNQSTKWTIKAVFPKRRKTSRKAK